MNVNEYTIKQLGAMLYAYKCQALQARKELDRKTKSFCGGIKDLTDGERLWGAMRASRKYDQDKANDY